MESAQQRLSPKQRDAGRLTMQHAWNTGLLHSHSSALNTLLAGRATLCKTAGIDALDCARRFKKTFTVVEDGVRRAATGVDSRFDVSGKAAKAARG